MMEQLWTKSTTGRGSLKLLGSSHGAMLHTHALIKEGCMGRSQGLCMGLCVGLCVGLCGPVWSAHLS